MVKAIGIFLAVLGLLSAQDPNPTQKPQAVNPDQPVIFRVNVVSRTTKAINYHTRSGMSKVDLHGTALLPPAKGEAKVDAKTGSTKIETHVEKLEPASKFGAEFLTYVLWAITPEGRANNIGELVLNGDKASLLSTTDLQTFGLIVTAEPYFAVTQPSDVVVMENFVRKDTTGTIEQVDAKFELLKRGTYTPNVNPADVHPFKIDSKTPLQLYEAENAIQIARWTGAERYANDTFQKALTGLQNAQGYLKGKKGNNSKPLETVAREATQMAEDARLITLRKMDEERLANERQAAADREAKAKSETQVEAQRADQEAQKRAQAEAQQRAEAEARQQAEAQQRAEAEARQQAEAQQRAEAEARQRAEAQQRAEAELRQREAELRQKAETEKAASEQARLAAETARTAAEQARAEAERVKAEAQAAAEKAAKDRVEAEAARDAALKQQQEAQAETEKARLATTEANRLREQAEKEKNELRQRLLQQFNLILETRDTARGLIVNMSDVLFDTAKYTLRPAAREKLAKIGGIVLGHPGLKLDVEGHTDSVGGDQYNQILSEKRAASVRDYLVQAGISAPSVSARGFGKTMPVAANSNAAGRQRNRRVELVVSGDIIGTPIGANSGALVAPTR